MKCNNCGKILAEGVSGLCDECFSIESERKKNKLKLFWEEGKKNQTAIEDFGYQVKTEIRRSENTVIYVATNEKNETVAIKRITVPVSSDIHSELSARISAEMEALSKISRDSGNRFVITYYDYKLVYDDTDYTYDLYIIMDYLTSLGQLYEETEFKVSDMLRMGIDVCEALTWCHENGRVHNNLNLNNIFINKDGRYVLGDFVFSEKTRNESEYCIAPEIMSGGVANSLTDIYSIGMVMFALINNGLPPFAQSESDIKSAENRLRYGEKPVLPSGINSRLRNVIVSAIENRDSRCSSANLFKKKLEGLLKELPEEWLNQKLKDISKLDCDEGHREPKPKQPIPTPKKPKAEKKPESIAPEEKELNKKNKRDILIIGIIVAVLITAIAVGVMWISTASNQKIYSLIDSGSYAVAFREISELHDKGKNVDSLLEKYIEACFDDNQYSRVIQAVELFSDEAFNDVEYFRNILQKIIDRGKERQVYSLVNILYKHENMRDMLGEMGCIVHV